MRDRVLSREKGFTMLELLIVIALLAFLASAVTMSIQAAITSWSYTKDQLSLQKVLSETMNMMIQGSYENYGLKDSMEIRGASSEEVAFVPPWVDRTHSAVNEDIIYTLEKPLKPGAAIPIGQIKLKDDDEWRVVPVERVELEREKNSQVRLGVTPPEEGDLRFIYLPDAEKVSEVIHILRWDKEDGAIYLTQSGEAQDISHNPFGVKFTKVQFFYFTNSNVPIGEDGIVSSKQLPLVTGVEVALEAELADQKQTLVNFISLRNAPLRTGYLTLQEGMVIPVPDSKNIHTLQLTNFSGVKDGDVLSLVATDEKSSSWSVKIAFEKIGSNPPRIKSITVESPSGTPVAVQFPPGGGEMNVNLLSVGEQGLYDYDDDDGIEDAVELKGKVNLEIKEMTLDGAGLFVRP